MADMHITSGGCHCGNIAYAFTSLVPPAEFGVRACQCTFCTKHGARWVSDPPARLNIEITDEAQVARYTFGHGTAEFLICKRCGALPAVLSDIGGTTYAVLNINTAENPAAYAAEAEATNFDAENSEERLKRRARRWIGTVAISGDG